MTFAILYVLSVFLMIFGLPVYAVFGQAMDCFYCPQEAVKIGASIILSGLWLLTSGTSIAIIFNKIAGQEFPKIVMVVAFAQTGINVFIATRLVLWLLSFN